MAAADDNSSRIWRLSGMGFTFATEILAGTLIGWGVDWWLGTAPWGIVIGTICGVIIGFLTFFRTAIKESNASARDAERLSRHLKTNESPSPEQSPQSTDEPGND